MIHLKSEYVLLAEYKFNIENINEITNILNESYTIDDCFKRVVIIDYNSAKEITFFNLPKDLSIITGSEERKYLIKRISKYLSAEIIETSYILHDSNLHDINNIKDVQQLLLSKDIIKKNFNVETQLKGDFLGINSYKGESNTKLQIAFYSC